MDDGEIELVYCHFRLFEQYMTVGAGGPLSLLAYIWGDGPRRTDSTGHGFILQDG